MNFVVKYTLYTQNKIFSLIQEVYGLGIYIEKQLDDVSEKFVAIIIECRSVSSEFLKG